MFWFTRKPSSGSHSQYLAKIAHLVQCGYTELVQDVVNVIVAYYAVTPASHTPDNAESWTVHYNFEGMTLLYNLRYLRSDGYN